MATKAAATTATQKNTEAPSLFNLAKLEIKVVGVTPLLTANPASMQPELNTSASARPKKSKDLTSQEVAEQAAYVDKDGDYAFPNQALVSAILEAAELMKLKVGSGRYAPSAASILASGISFDYEVEFAKLVDPTTGKPLRTFTVDARRGVNPSTGGGVVVIRPRFDEWAATFHLLVDTGNDQLMAVLHSSFSEILRYAGSSVGLGAFRAYVKPRAKAKRGVGGPFGKFSAQVSPEK